jgi:hypothetical protein
MHLLLLFLFAAAFSVKISNHCFHAWFIFFSEFIFLRNLMAKQDMSELGFRNVDEAYTSPDTNSQLESPPNEQKENKIAV